MIFFRKKQQGLSSYWHILNEPDQVNELLEASMNRPQLVFKHSTRCSISSMAQANEKLSSIALVSGPGSYTGLRIGAGLAKGLAYGLDLPMYALPMTEVLALAALPLVQEAGLIQPVIDARRMEVYTARFSNRGERLSEDEALVIEDSFFEEPKYLIGDGVPKIREEFGEKKGIHYLELPPLGHAMQLAALKAVEHRNPIDTAYWEPHYLKTFNPGPKRSA